MIAENLRFSLPLSDVNPLYRAGTEILSTLIGEQTKGRNARRQLRKEVDQTLEDPRFKGGKNGKSYEAFMRKLDQTTPRMTGALSLYSAFSERPYGEVAKGKGLEAFYLFWGLGEEQDDLIDTPNKSEQKPLSDVIFRSDGFLRGAIHLLEAKITQGNMGEKEKRYLKEKIAGWYRFLSNQEQRVQSEDFASFDFSYCRKYREDQNQKAGEVAVAILNWDKCLDPNLRKLEETIPHFSYTTQLVDDIGDSVEDVQAKRPSFAIGALRENPAEYERFLTEAVMKGVKKVHPSVFRRLAPESSRLIDEQFREYCADLEVESGTKGKGFSLVAKLVYKLFPSFRDFLFKRNPELAYF